MATRNLSRPTAAPSTIGPGQSRRKSSVDASKPLEVLTVRPVGLLDQRQLQSAPPRVANVQQTCSRHEPRHRAISRLNGLKATDNMRYQADESVAVANQTRGVDDNIVTAQKRPELICRQGGNIGFMHFNLVPPCGRQFG